MIGIIFVSLLVFYFLRLPTAPIYTICISNHRIFHSSYVLFSLFVEFSYIEHRRGSNTLLGKEQTKPAFHPTIHPRILHKATLYRPILVTFLFPSSGAT